MLDQVHNTMDTRLRGIRTMIVIIVRLHYLSRIKEPNDDDYHRSDKDLIGDITKRSCPFRCHVFITDGSRPSRCQHWSTNSISKCE